MKILHLLDNIDPMPLVIQRVKPPLCQDGLYALLSLLPLQEPDSASVGTGSKELSATPVVAAPDGGTWVAMSEEPIDKDRVFQVRGPEVGIGAYKHFARWFDGQWYATAGDEQSAAMSTWISGSCNQNVEKPAYTHWLKPSAPQSPGADEWIEITADSVLPDLGPGEFELRNPVGDPVGGFVLLRLQKATRSLWTHYRRITKQGN